MAFNHYLPDKKQWLQMALTAAVTGTIVYSIASRLQGDLDAPTQPVMTSGRGVEQAVQAQHAGNYQQALSVLESVVKQTPDNLEAQLMRSALLVQAGDYSAARTLLEQLQQRHPDRPEPLNNLAAIYAAQGDHKQAITTLKQALDTHPSYAQVYSNLSEIYAAIASDAYSKALGLSERPEGPQLTLLQQPGHPVPYLHPGQLISNNAAAVKPDTTASVEPESTLTPTQPAQPESVQTESIQAEPVQAEPVQTESVQTESVQTKPATTVTQQVQSDTAQPPPAQQPEVPDSTATVAGDIAPAATMETSRVPATDAQAAATAPDQMHAVIQHVEAWADAWQQQDVARYLNTYISGYTPDAETSHEAWAQQRRERITAPVFIELSLKGMELEALSDKTVAVRFSQHYRSDRYRDREEKRLVLEQQADTGEWKIIQEG